MSRFILAGLALGAAHLDPRLSPMAWAGAAALPWALAPGRGAVRTALGLLLCGLTTHVVALHWLVATATRYLEVGPRLPVGFGIAIGCWASCTLLVWGPAALASAPCRRYSPSLWLPPALALGEALRAVLTGFTQDDFLYSQWQVEWVLRCLAHAGWTPTLLLLLHVCVFVGEAITRREAWRALPTAAVLATLLALPGPVPSRPPADIGVVAATHSPSLRSTEPPPGDLASVRLLITPEAYFPDRIPGVDEGPLPPLCWPGLPVGREHLLGSLTRSRAGLQNSVLHVDRNGCIDAARAKSALAPIGERRFAGLGPLGEGFVPGREVPLLRAAGRKIIPLLCIEVFDRSLVEHGRHHGGELIAVLASDVAYAGSDIAVRQSVAALALRSAESGLPSVRASLGGVAAFIDEGGHVVCSAESRGINVLTCEGGTR